MDIASIFTMLYGFSESIISFIASEPIIGVTLLGVGCLTAYVLLQKSEVVFKVFITWMMIFIFIIFVAVMVFAISQKFGIFENVTSFIDSNKSVTTTLPENAINVFT